jgi:hypothetical protein
VSDGAASGASHRRRRLRRVRKEALDKLSDALGSAIAEDPRKLGHLIGELHGVALGEATGHDDGGAWKPVYQLQGDVDRLLLGRFDEATTVDEDEVRRARVVHPLPSGGDEPVAHRLGIDLILRAPEVFDVDGGGNGGYGSATRDGMIGDRHGGIAQYIGRSSRAKPPWSCSRHRITAATTSP